MTLPLQSSPKALARAAAIFLLISILGGAYGEMFVISKLVVSNDSFATAQNLLSSESTFRLGFLCYLFEAISDVTLIYIFYLLLKPVNKTVASLSVLFGLVSMITFAFSELFCISSLLVLKADYLKSFSQEQINSLALLFIKLYSYGSGVFMLFYGIATMLRGYLIFRSAYLPKFIGLLLLLGGACFVLRNVLLVIVPIHVSDLLLIPTALSMLVLLLWLFIKGVDLEKWNLALARNTA